MSSGAATVSSGAAQPLNNATLHVATRNADICRYFQRGICRFGDMCRFSHDLVGGDVDVVGGGGNDDDNVDTLIQQYQQRHHNIHQPQQHYHHSNNNSNRPSTSKYASGLNWANAPVFVPNRQQSQSLDASVDAATNKTWAQVAGAGVVGSAGAGAAASVAAEPNYLEELCPYENPCPYDTFCLYALHWELCKMCDQYCLHPSDQTQRRKHNQECLQQHERDMELSFAIARSKDKTCGICFDTIMEKSGREKRFGILPNCAHIFCLECIRKWRQAKQFEHKITRSCPECRVASDFVCPSAFWVETKEDKDKLLNDYRSALGIKDCKYFNKGDGKCPFGNKCFYKHALPNGDLVDVGLPKRVRKLHGSANELIDWLDIYLWEFVDQRDYHWLDVLDSDDSEDSDWSESN